MYLIGEEEDGYSQVQIKRSCNLWCIRSSTLFHILFFFQAANFVLYSRLWHFRLD